MADMNDILSFGISTILTVVIYGYFLPLLNGAVVGSAVVAIAGVLPIVIMAKAAMAILRS